MWTEEALRKLKEAGLRLTPQRMKLVEIIGRIGSEHPTISEIYDALRREFPSVSFSTLYTNLLLLRSLKLLDFFFINGETRIEVNCSPNINLIQSESVKDFVDDELIEHLERRIGRRIRIVNIFFD